MKNFIARLTIFLASILISTVICAPTNAEVTNEAYWADASSDTRFVSQLDLAVGEERVVRLKAEIPTGKTLKAFNISMTYDDTKASVMSAVATSGAAFPPTNINLNTSGVIVINGFNTTGVAGPTVVSFIDVTVKGLASGSFDFAITVNSFGASSSDQFPPTPDALTIAVGGGGPTTGSITGTVGFEAFIWASGNIEVGAFTDAEMMTQPVGGVYLTTGPGSFEITGLAAGTYYVGAHYGEPPNDFLGYAFNNPITIDTTTPGDAGTITLYSGGGPTVEPPFALAGADFTAIVNTQVALDGLGSQGAATYAWTQTAGATVALTGADSAQPIFTPTAAGDYTFQLIVNNGIEDSAPDTVTVTVVAAGTDEDAILTLYVNLNAALQTYIAGPTTANMDVIMAFFSDAFLHDGEDKTAMRAMFEQDLSQVISIALYATNIQSDGTNATCFQTEVVEVYNEWGEPFTDVESFTMHLIKEGGTWKAYGNQKAYDVWVDTISKTDGTTTSYKLEFGLEVEPGTIASVTVTGPAISGDPVSLFDDGLHRDSHLDDGEWANVISLAAAPTVGETYTFTINLAAGGDPVIVTAAVSGIMSSFASNGTVSETMPPIVSWDAATGAVFYTVQLFDDLGEMVWGMWGIPSPFVEYMGPPLFAGKEYQWRVLAFDANENISVSEFFTFTVTFGPEGGDKSISGTVTDPSGSPIPYIWVNAWSDSAMFGFGDQTDDDGNYTIANLVAASDYRVDVWHEDYAFQFYKKDVACALPAASGGVVDYSNCGIDPVGTADWGQVTLVDVFVNAASGVNFIMSAGVSISGTVKDSSGNSVGGVWVNAWSESTGAGSGTETNPDGTYTLMGVVEGTDYRVEIWDDLYAQQFYKYQGYLSGDSPPANNDYSALTSVGTNIWDEVTLVATSEANPAQGVNFIVAEGKLISGLVLADGQPLAHVWVNAWSESQMTGMGAETDQNGEYTIRGLVAASDYKLDVWTQNYAYQVYNNKTDWMNADLVDISVDDAVNINFNLSSGYSISGKVLDGNGDGVAGVWVNAYSDTAMFGRGEQTDITGAYTITGLVAAADYRVDIWAEGYAGGFYSASGIVPWEDADLIDASTDPTDINFTLLAGVFIEGTITLPGGNTDYSNIWVNAGSESGLGSGTHVNSDGTYKIIGLVPAGDYKIDVWSDDYGMVYYKDGVANNSTKDWMQATSVSTLAGSVSNIDINLTAGNTISGTVSGLAAGDWAWVNAWSDFAMSGNGTEVIGTGSDVSYTIKGLDPVEGYRVEISSDKYQLQFYNGQTDWTNADPVDVSTENALGIDFALSTGASISGSVVDSQGSGAAYVWVDAWSDSGSWGGASTDADGNFTINGLTDGVVYHMNIWHEDYANQTLEVTTGTDAAGSVSFTVSAGISISGTVRNDSGNPIAGVWVNAWSDSAMTGRSEPTDADGNYVIKGLAAASDYRVDVWIEGYANQFYNNKTMWHEADLVDTTGGSVTGIDFTLVSGKSISGSITIPNAPDPGNDIWVNAWSETQSGMGTPVSSADFSDNGDSTWTATYEITNLLPAGDYKVDVWSDDYQHVFYKEDDVNGVFDWMQASSVDVSTDNAIGIDFELGTGRSISGTVSVPAGGSLDNLWVNAWSESAGSWGSGMVDPANGTYTITGLASAADFRVDVWTEDFGYQIYNGKRNWEDADLVDTDSGDVPGIDFNLSAGRSISGRITDSGGTGVADAWINVWSESFRFGRGEPTDADGYYIIKGLEPASDYKLDVWTYDYGMALYKADPPNNRTNDWMQADKIDVTSINAEAINIILAEGRSISGNVKNSSGDPIQYAWVNAWSMAGGNGAQTDANGDYEIKGLPSSDSYKVDVWSEGYVNVFYNNKTDWMNADVVDISSGDAIDIDFVLGTGNSISGTVTSGGSPVQHVWVNAWSESAGSWGGASTDSSGNYEITGLAPASDYVVDIWSETYAHQFYNQKTDWMDADRVDVSSGDQAAINFNLSTGNYISGTITLPDGDTDYSYIWVNAWSDDTFSGNGSPVKHDGTYKIVGLAPGTGYKIDVWSDTYVHVFYDASAAPNYTTTDWGQATPIDILGADATGKDFTLGSGASISGTVYLEGTPQTGVWVDAWSSSTGTWGGAETASDGTYTITGLLTGSDYVVSTWSWDYINDSQSDVSTGDAGVDLNLSAGVSISGNLRNDAAGIGGVWIDAWSSELGVGGWALTDGNDNVGDFTISGLAPNATYTVSAATGNHGFISEDVYVASNGNMYVNGDDSTGDLVVEVDLYITTGSKISGTVTKADGTTVITDKEVIVSAFDTSDGGTTYTFYNSTAASTADGTYELTNLPPGDYKILVRAEGYVDMWYNGAASIDGATFVNLSTANVPDINFALNTP